MKLTETKDGVILEIYVKPNSPRFEVQVEGDEVVVHSTEEPEKGKVNKEITKEFTRLFHNRTEIISGLTSRQKKLLIAGVTAGEAEKVLTKK